MVVSNFICDNNLCVKVFFADNNSKQDTKSERCSALVQIRILLCIHVMEYHIKRSLTQNKSSKNLLSSICDSAKWYFRIRQGKNRFGVSFLLRYFIAVFFFFFFF